MVYLNNEYRLPNRFKADDIIIDIGAHTGSFAYAVLVRGAGQVISIEAHPQNYGLACCHLHGAIQLGLLDIRWGAVWRSDNNNDALYYSNFTPIDDTLSNTGNVTVHQQENNQPTPKFTLDDLLQEQHPKHIRLLKLDCEGSEFPILLTSTQLYLVDEIVGEFHETTEHTIEQLLNHLQAQDFTTEHQQHQRYENGVWIPQSSGYFRAIR